MMFLFLSGCTYERFDPATLCAVSGLELTIGSVTDVTVCGASDGAIVVVGAGGTAPYEFELDGAGFASASSFGGIAAGAHTVSIRDAKGCVRTTPASVSVTTTTLQLSVSSSINSGCPTPNGGISVTAAGGQEPYRYKLNSTAYQSQPVFSGLAAGTYSVAVEDASGCVATTNTTVERNGPTFSVDIQAIIANNCATSRCHDGGRSPKLTTYAEISANGNSIVSAINRNMPPGGKLTATEINLITCWVNDGTPQ